MMSRMCTGVLAREAAETPSFDSAFDRPARSEAVDGAIRSPPEAADVEQQHRDDEHEDEDRNRRSHTQVARASERRAPHRERQHAGVVLHRAGGDGDDDVEDLEDVDQHRDEDDREHRHEEGAVTRRNTCHSVAPSVRAASMTSRGMASPAAITTIAKPAQIQM